MYFNRRVHLASFVLVILVAIILPHARNDSVSNVPRQKDPVTVFALWVPTNIRKVDGSFANFILGNLVGCVPWSVRDDGHSSHANVRP
jgi:hypothetical protein